MKNYSCPCAPICECFKSDFCEYCGESNYKILSNLFYKNMLNRIYGVRSDAKYVSNRNNTYTYDRFPTINNVIFNDPATIVFWSDNTKTVVKTQDGEEFDPEKGLAMAITKKYFGNKGSYYNNIKKWTDKYHEEMKNKSFYSFYNSDTSSVQEVLPDTDTIVDRIARIAKEMDKHKILWTDLI